MSQQDIYVYIILIFAILFILICTHNSIKKVQQLKRYTQIDIGMAEAKMLEIMGNEYNRSLLSNGRKKYEWRINVFSSGAKGIRVYSGIKKVDIYTKNEIVTEVKPYNI